MKHLISILAILAVLNTARGFSVSSGSISSSFGGSVLVTGKVSSDNHGPIIEMKKGKDNVPASMRAQYKRQKEMSKMREEMMAAQKPGADGLPVFNLYVRTKRANVRNILFY